ncbi:MAG: hypothetical protein OEY19_07220 [Gammaproteobacteria bacterium]|nr:hypothetical protein [Gammaproteobacteria bacterium]MDH5630737.1 hypothetical protein [Gammaproteobacteria bacterium]
MRKQKGIILFILWLLLSACQSTPYSNETNASAEDDNAKTHVADKKSEQSDKRQPTNKTAKSQTSRNPSKKVKQQIPRSLANLKLIKQTLEEAEYLKGLNYSNKLYIADKHIEELLTLHQQLLKLFVGEPSDTSEREIIIKQLENLLAKSRSEEQRQQYLKALNPQKVIWLLDEAMLFYRQKNYLQSARRLIASEEIDPDITNFKEYFSLKDQLIKKLHDQAIVLFHNDALNKALMRWQLVLELQPDDPRALQYSKQTQEKLEQQNKQENP